MVVLYEESWNGHENVCGKRAKPNEHAIGEIVFVKS